MRVLAYTILSIYLVLSCFSCGSYTQEITSADQAFELKQYAVASGLYAKEYDDTKEGLDKATKAYNAGLSAEYSGNISEATKWYELAIKEGYGPTALRQYAYALKSSERYDDAATAFAELIEKTMDNFRFKRELGICKQAQLWNAQTDNSAFQILQTGLNSRYSDYSAAVLPGNRILFASDRPFNESSEEYTWTGAYFSDLYVWDEAYDNVTPFDLRINGPHNEGTAVYLESSNSLIFTRCTSQDNEALGRCKLYISYYENNAWSEPALLDFQEDAFDYMHPTVDPTEKLLVFSSNLSGGQGSYDLYYSQLVNDFWGKPVALPSHLNTEGKEVFPFLDKDTLYYSSDFLLGMGGLDVFKTFVQKDGSWNAPINMKSPVNSGADDFGFMTLSSGDTEAQFDGYLSSNRNGGNGGDDIYAFVKRTIYKPVDTAMITKEYYISVQVLSSSDSITAIERAAVTIDSNTFKKTNSSGFVLEKGTMNQQYTFIAQKEGFLINSIRFDGAEVLFVEGENISTVNLKIYLDPINYGEEYTLENIYYDLDKSVIRDDAKPSLDKLVITLKENSSLRIKLGSHTDCRAGAEYNDELSQRRAQSAVDYIVSKGINSSRLQAVGYGETKPVINCVCEECSEDEHQMNRRTTFSYIQ